MAIQTPTIEILGNRINAVQPSDVLEIIDQHVASSDNGLLHIITADSLAMVRTTREPDFKKLMDAAELVVPDGAGIIWASKILGIPLPGRVPGVALVSQICENSVKNNQKIFFIGSKPGIATKAAESIKERTKANIVGVEHGYFSSNSEDENAMLQKIADSKADVVFVALGVPRQEEFITKLRKYMNHGVAIGVGGSFDVISGNLPRAPQWMQKCGLEWLFRLYLEPKRFRRMLDLPVFVQKIIHYRLHRQRVKS